MMTLARDSLENTLRGYAQGLLGQIAQDYKLDNQELINRYLTPMESATIKNGDGIPAPLLVLAQNKKTRARKDKPEKKCCKGITAKGQPCKFTALGDGFCKKHSDQEKKKTEGAPVSTKTPKAPKPRHTHLVEEEPDESCSVCEVQGNSTKPQAPRQQFEIEGADDIKMRLARMLAEAETDGAPAEINLTPEEIGNLLGDGEESDLTLKEIENLKADMKAQEAATATEPESEEEPATEEPESEEEPEEEDESLKSRLIAILAEESDEDEDEDEEQ
jgi:hypothetical protein